MVPEEIENYCRLAEVLKEQGRLSESIACYQQALAFKPDSAEIYYDLGNTYVSRNLVVGPGATLTVGKTSTSST